MARSIGLSAVQRRTLDQLSQIPALAEFYLAGGTAIGAHLGHRQSLDLELFSRSARTDLAVVQRSLVQAIPTTTVVSSSEVALSLRVHGALVDVVRYPYALLVRPHAGPQGFATASLRDLAAMKLAAVARRGIRRDFWDVFAIATLGKLPLAAMATAYRKKFAVAEADLYAVLRALTYFDQAEAETLWPKGLTPRKWAQIKAFFEQQAPKLLGSSR